MMITPGLPQRASHYLQQNFPDGFQFDEFRSENSIGGNTIFMVTISDGNLVHDYIFSNEGTVVKHDITPAFAEDCYDASGQGEYHDDDY